LAHSQSSSDADDGPYLSVKEGEADEVGYDSDVIINEGNVLDKYTIQGSLGSGGFGSVYLAEDTYLKEKVALKVVVAGESDKAQNACEQIVHEFKLREKISDVSHIVRAKDPRTCEHMNLTLVLLPMDFAEGGSFRDWLKKNKDEEARTKGGLKIFRQACLGVKAIHDAGLSHLDIKPANILLVDNTAKIADFGIGRYGASMFANNPKQVKRQGIGTPQYMSPEQFHSARQKDIGPASDIYSLGIVLYELLDGSLPFDGPSYDEYRQKHLHDAPTEIKGAFAKYWGVVSRCLAKKADNRYSDIDQLISDLDRVAQGASLSADVSCPECGHINSDTSHDICEKCGSNLPDSLFHECRRCIKKLRLDTEICPACGFHVMAYYVLQDRWGRVQKLKDEDPVEAMELLEVVLHDGAGEHEESALELVRELRKKQSQISGLIAEADKAVAGGEPEEALEVWRTVLEVIPRHRGALEQIEKLEALMESFAEHLSEAINLMNQAEFEDADANLQTCLELIPQREKARNMLETCRQRGHEYTTAFGQATKCAKQKLLLKANQYIEVALAQARKSSEATALADELASTLKKTKGLTDQARNQLSHAEFGKVHESIAEIEKLQADNESVSEMKKHLDKTQDAYVASIRDVQLAVNDRDLGKASNAVEKALELCPESLEAKSLLKQLSIDRDKALNLLEEAKSLMLAAKFPDADILLEQVQELWPTVEGLEEIKELLAKNRVEYEEHMQRSHQAKTHKALDEALREVELACGVCPQAAEAEMLLEAIEGNRSRVHTLLGEAVSSTKAARFDEANTRLLQVEDLWTNASGLAKAQEELVRSREQFSKAMLTAGEAQVQKDLAKALQATETATSVCPKSKEALALAKSIKKDQLAAKEHLRKAEDACKAGDFEKARNEISQGEKIWPKAPGLGEAKMTLLGAKKALSRRKIKWATATAVVLVSVYLLAKLVLILVNRQYANAAIRYAKKGDYVTANRQYYKCYTIPLLVSSPQLPEEVRRQMDAADVRRKEQFASAMNQAGGLFSKGQIEQAESVVNKALELVVTDEENQQANFLREKISDAAAQRQHDVLVARAQAEILLAKKIKLLEKALSSKQTSSTRQLLQAAIAEQKRRPKIGDTITNSIDMKFTYIPQGEFMMGSPPTEKDRASDQESPRHHVVISKDL